MSIKNNANLDSKQFNWQECWYPITFVQDFFEDKPYSFSLYDEPLVLFRNTEGELVCLRDLCPHRAAQLSDGQIIEGKIECLYHGWQFGNDGECVHIPQLETSAKIPKQACIKSFPVIEFQGIIWVWLGDKDTARQEFIPEVFAAEKTGIFIVDTVTDLPYDQNFLIENFLDPAHVPISHDGTELGMKREFASPLRMEVNSSSIEGFTGRYQKSVAGNLPWSETAFIKVNFTPPCLVQYEFGSEKTGVIGGFDLYALPLGAGESRVLVRRYGNFFKRSFKLKPRWLEHLRQNKLLEEDLPFILKQQAYVEHTGKNLKDIYLPLKSSDVFVLEHRKWLDKFGENLPFYQGFTSYKVSQNSHGSKMKLDRFSRHTQICSSCFQAYQTINLLKNVLIAAAILLAAIALVADNQKIEIICVLFALLAIGKVAFLMKLRESFL